MFAGVQLGKVHPVVRSQQARRDERRTGVSLITVFRTDIAEHAAIGMLRRDMRFDPLDTLSGLAGFYGFGVRQVVEGAAGVGLDVGKGFVLAGHVVQDPGEQRVLVDVRKVAGMIDMLVGQHAQAIPAWRPSATGMRRCSHCDGSSAPKGPFSAKRFRWR